jgi:hypothetical protein
MKSFGTGYSHRYRARAAYLAGSALPYIRYPHPYRLGTVRRTSTLSSCSRRRTNGRNEEVSRRRRAAYLTDIGHRVFGTRVFGTPVFLYTTSHLSSASSRNMRTRAFLHYMRPAINSTISRKVYHNIFLSPSIAYPSLLVVHGHGIVIIVSNPCNQPAWNSLYVPAPDDHHSQLLFGLRSFND